MTTIAYRDRFLVADTQMTNGNIRQTAPPKIKVLPNGMVLASAGDLTDIANAQQRLGKDDWESAKYKKIKNFEAIGIWKGQVFMFEGSTAPLPLVDKYCAIGSGWELAIAHMAKGYSAIDAVLFASTLDINTNDQLQIYELPPADSTGGEAPKQKARRAK